MRKERKEKRRGYKTGYIACPSSGEDRVRALSEVVSTASEFKSVGTSGPDRQGEVRSIRSVEWNNSVHMHQSSPHVDFRAWLFPD